MGPEVVQTPALQKNPPQRFAVFWTLPGVWPSWKFRENSAWMKTRSIFTFPFEKSFSVIAPCGLQYRLPQQTHGEINLTTRRSEDIKDHKFPVKGKHVFNTVALHEILFVVHLRINLVSDLSER